MVLITEETLVHTEGNTEATGAVAEAEVGVMIVETEVANLREITETDEMTGAHLCSSVTIEDEIEYGDEKTTEVGDNHRLRDEAVHRITPPAIFEIHRQAST
jgi:hypothetical protein